MCVCAMSENQAQIEVTPEMIEAGEDFLDTYDPDYSDSAKYLADIFRAMHAASGNTTKRGDVE